MEQLLLGFVHLVTLAAIVFSLAIPLYCIPTAAVAVFRPSPYSPWPLLLLALLWLAQWPLGFLLIFALPNYPSIGGDSHDSLSMDSAFMLVFVLLNAGPFYWVYRHRDRFLPAE